MPNRICSVEGCSKPHYGLGWCSMHYSRMRTTGMLERLDRSTPPQTRFWSKVEKTDTCWLWIGAKNDVGYGQINVKGKRIYAHRLSCEWAHGPIPAGMEVDHICHTHACVRPDHLRIVTPKQNVENHSGPRFGNSTGYLGVTKKRKRFVARVASGSKTYHAGTFDTAEEANEAVVRLRNLLLTHNDFDRRVPT